MSTEALNLLFHSSNLYYVEGAHNKHEISKAEIKFHRIINSRLIAI